MEKNYSLLHIAYGSLQGEIMKLFLESKGIKTLVYQESVGTTYGFTVGPLGAVKIFVRNEDLDNAKELLRELEQGDFKIDENIDSPTDPNVE